MARDRDTRLFSYPQALVAKSAEPPAAHFADTPAFKSAVTAAGLLVLLVGLLVVLPILGVDRRTTIDVRWSPFVITAMIIALLATIPVWFWWFLPRADLRDIPQWHLKHDSPGTWLLTGIACGVMASVAAIYISYYALSVATQHVRGSPDRLQASVLDVTKPSRKHGRWCRRSAQFAINWDDRAVRICVDRLLDVALEPGQNVTLLVTRNFIGTSVVGIARPALTIESFSYIGPETKMQQVLATLGAPDRDIGSGIHIYVYDLADGSQIWIGSPDGSEIWYVRHRSMTPEKLTTIYERK